MNDYELNKYCEDIARDIVADARDRDQAMDWACESADSSEYVIYTYKAHELCQGCDTEQGEDFVAECYAGIAMTYDEIACRIAYGEIDARVRALVWDMWEDKEGEAA